MSRSLTPRPRVPLLVQVAVAGSLSTAGLGCGDDDATSDTAADVAPTAGPCVHADGSQLPECQATGTGSGSTMDSANDSAMDTTMTSTGSATTTDVPPTAGPCVHADGSQLPECQTTGDVDETTAADSGSDSGSGSGSGSGGSSTTTG